MKEATRHKIAILIIAMFQMSAIGLSTILSQLSQVFPEAGDAVIQGTSTFTMLTAVAFSLLCVRFSAAISQKTLTLIGLLLICLVGLGGFFFHQSLVMVYLWAGMLGVGAGLVMPMAMAFIRELIPEAEQESMVGIQIAFVNIGGILIAMLAGVFASQAWYSCYLAYLIAAPAGLAVLVLMRRLPVRAAVSTQAQNSQQFSPALLFYMLLIFLFMMISNVFPTNIALFLTENVLGDSAKAGAATAAFLVGGMAAGISYKFIADRFRGFVYVLGYAVLAVGGVVCFLSTSYLPFLAGILFAGHGVSWIVSRCLVDASEKAGADAVFGAAVILASNNLGAFVSPFLLTPLALKLLGNAAVRYRFALAAILAVAIALLLIPILRKATGGGRLNDGKTHAR